MKNLISISGNGPESGKDTAGLIIQYLVCLDKNTLAPHQMSFKEFERAPVSNEIQSGWQIKKFAAKTTEAYKIITGVDFHKLNREEKELERPRYRDFANKTKEALGEDVWVDALFLDHKPPKLSEYHPSKWIITDCRYPQELEAVKERGGLTIRVTRYPETIQVSRGPGHTETIPFDPANPKHMDHWRGECARGHASEISLDSAVFDEEIINNGSIEDLIEKVRQILIKHEIL